MDLGRHLSSLQDALTLAARSGGDDVQEAAERLAGSLEPALRLTFLELASELADDITVRLDGDSVEVRLRGGQPEIVVERRPRGDQDVAPPAPPSPPPPPPPPAQPVRPEEGDPLSRITLRLPESLRGRVDDAAATAGVSLNTWFVRAVQDALDPPVQSPAPPSQHTARRMTGWVR